MNLAELERMGAADWPLPVRYIDIPSPAAGTNATWAEGADFAFRVVAARAQVDTDATVANRYVSLDFISGRNNPLLRNVAGAAIQASTVAQKFEWNKAWNVTDYGTSGPVMVPVLSWWLPQAITVGFTLDNKVAADALTGLHLVIELLPAEASESY